MLTLQLVCFGVFAVLVARQEDDVRQSLEPIDALCLQLAQALFLVDRVTRDYNLALEEVAAGAKAD